MFKLFKDDEDYWRQGIVTEVGKSTGKYKNDAWINEDDGKVNNHYSLFRSNLMDERPKWEEIYKLPNYLERKNTRIKI